MKESEHLVTLAQEFWNTDQVVFARGSWRRDWFPANEFAECIEARNSESRGFNQCANNNLLVASDGSGGQNFETGRIWSGHFLDANSQ